MAILRISNQLKLDKGLVDLTHFIRSNPKYEENERLGFSNISTPRHIHLYTENGKAVYFPRGLVKELFSLVPNLSVEDRTITAPAHFPESNILLKDFQKPAVKEMLDRNQGILVGPCGSGKTVMGIELILKRGQKSAVFVHTRDLLDQWCDRFKQFTDITPGVVNADRIDVRDVTICMVQSLNRPLEQGFINAFGLVLLDEAHHCPAFSFRKLLSQFPARYRYGLTATPDRRDNLSFILEAVIGPVIHEIKRDSLYASNDILRPRVRVIHTNHYNPDATDYAALLKGITEDFSRNSQILNLVSAETENGHFSLVLSERISHAEALYKAFPTFTRERFGTALLTSKSSKKDREKAISGMNSGKIQVIFATKLAEEALDIRRLDRVFLTCPIRSKNKVIQMIGRTLRVFPGKLDAVIFDFRDSLNSLAESQYNTRLNEVYSEFDIAEIPYRRADGN